MVLALVLVLVLVLHAYLPCLGFSELNAVLSFTDGSRRYFSYRTEKGLHRLQPDTVNKPLSIPVLVSERVPHVSLGADANAFRLFNILTSLSLCLERVNISYVYAVRTGLESQRRE